MTRPTHDDNGVPLCGNFRVWLLHFTREDGALGDIARDVAADDCLEAADYDSIREHLAAQHEPSDLALEALENAYRLFRTQP